MPGRPESGAARPILGVVRTLFDRFHMHGIGYCHWKSNEHLAAGLAGETDLDVLVDANDPDALACILAEAGFKQVFAVADRAYPGIDDFLGLDLPTGRLTHLHLHHRLVLGDRRVKSYRLPWEDRVLGTRRMDSTHDVYVADPHLELVLLVIRMALKLRLRDIVRSALGRPYFQGGTLREYRWLLARVERARVFESAHPLIGEKAALSLVRLLDTTPSASELLAFRRAVQPSLDTYRTYSSPAARRERWRREWRTRWNGMRQRRFGAPVPSKRTVERGLMVAFMGCDGSGKSTTTREVARWLAWKLDVHSVYFGSGDGPASLFRQPFRIAKSLRQLRAPAAGGPPGARSGGRPIRRGEPAVPGRGLRAARNLWWALAVASEKRTRLSESREARRQGMVVICDRFPQTQIAGFTDGPRLTPWLSHASAILRALAAWEQAIYQRGMLEPPDLVVKLQVTPDTAARRKPGMDQATLERRADAVARVDFPRPTQVVHVDAEQPLPEMLRQIKQAIWERL